MHSYGKNGCLDRFLRAFKIVNNLFLKLLRAYFGSLQAFNFKKNQWNKWKK